MKCTSNWGHLWLRHNKKIYSPKPPVLKHGVPVGLLRKLLHFTPEYLWVCIKKVGVLLMSDTDFSFTFPGTWDTTLNCPSTIGRSYRATPDLVNHEWNPTGSNRRLTQRESNRPRCTHSLDFLLFHRPHLLSRDSTLRAFDSNLVRNLIQCTWGYTKSRTHDTLNSLLTLDTRDVHPTRYGFLLLGLVL